MAGTQIGTSVTIISSLLGFQAISLTNFVTSAQSVIAAGSKIEIASAFFTFGSDTTPGATSWTAVTTANVAYITCLPIGSAGVQTLTVDYSDTAPVWSDSKQGWYQSAGSLVRYIGGVTKTSSTQYDDAFVLYGEQAASATHFILRPNGALMTGSIVPVYQNSWVDATEDELFGEFSPFITSGQTLLASGAISPTSGHTIIVSRITGQSATAINLTGTATNDYTGESYTINDGDATVVHFINVAF